MTKSTTKRPTTGATTTTAHMPTSLRSRKAKPAVKTDTAPPAVEAKRQSKLDIVIALLSRAQGATIADMMHATGWQAHSVRGALAGAIKKKRGLAVAAEAAAGGRLYRIAASEA